MSTGASKGGMASIYHRRFYPDDVDGTVAYVAPNDVVNAEDSAYTDFFQRAGTPECRAALTALEREALGPRREELVARYVAAAAAGGWTFQTLQSPDRAFEMLVLDTAWGFWQYHTAAECPRIPSASASTDALYDFLDEIVSFRFYSDQGLDFYVPVLLSGGHPARLARAEFRPSQGPAALQGPLPGAFVGPGLAADALRASADAGHRQLGQAARRASCCSSTVKTTPGAPSGSSSARGRETHIGMRWRAVITDRTSRNYRRANATRRPPPSSGGQRSARLPARGWPPRATPRSTPASERWSTGRPKP